jgi:hypothetical protein
MEISSSELPLPPQFESIEELVSMSSDRIKKNPLVNVIGMVEDYQPPIATKGSGINVRPCILNGLLIIRRFQMYHHSCGYVYTI